MTDLRECPHCGGDNLNSHRTDTFGGGYYIICEDCGMTGPWGGGSAEAAALWNALPRRAEPPADPVEAMARAMFWKPAHADKWPADYVQAERDDAEHVAAVAAAHADARVREERERAARCCDRFDGPVSKSAFVNAQAIAAQQIRAAIREGRGE